MKIGRFNGLNLMQESHSLLCNLINRLLYVRYQVNMATQELVNQTEHLELAKDDVVETQECEERSGDVDAEELYKSGRLRKIDGTIGKKAKPGCWAF